MKPSEKLAVATYTAHPSFWKDKWETHVIRELAAKTREYIMSLHPIQFDSQFTKVLDRENTAQVDASNSVAQTIADEIAADENFKSALKSTFSDESFDAPKGGKLKTILKGAVADSIKSCTAASISTAVTEKDIYPELANLLSNELAKIGTDESDPCERKLLNYAIVIYHLNRWTCPLRELPSFLLDLNEGILGIRGKLISIQNLHPAQTDSDRFLLSPSEVPQGEIPDPICQQSSLLKAIEAESKETSSGNGFFCRLIPPDNPLASSLVLRQT